MIARMSTEQTAAQTLTDEQWDLLSITAKHEAGHAVMRWVVGWPLTAVTAGIGDGLCAGTGRRVHVRADLLVTLAGVAAESGYGLAKPDLSQSHFIDLDEARQLLCDGPESLRYVPATDGQTVHRLSIDDALQHYFDKACDLLWRHNYLVEAIAERLIDERTLSARTVAAICREYAKR